MANPHPRDEINPQRLVPSVQDKWVPYDHPLTGLKAAIRNLRGGTNVATHEPVTFRANTPAPAHCPFCGEELRPSERKCSRCLLEVVPTSEALEVSEPTSQPAAPFQVGAVYTLEFPISCPHCDKSMRTVRVSRLLRTQVSFTSTLPRKGYAIVCPECARMISAELSGMI